jgi:predicted nucleic acid-binding Zn ribbon protein
MIRCEKILLWEYIYQESYPILCGNQALSWQSQDNLKKVQAKLRFITQRMREILNKEKIWRPKQRINRYRVGNLTRGFQYRGAAIVCARWSHHHVWWCLRWGRCGEGCTNILKKSQKTEEYTTKEDRCICRSWLAISEDIIRGDEQKRKIILERGYPRFPWA